MSSKAAWLILVVASICGYTVSALAATNYALIVAVSDYPNLDEHFYLNGPKNDAVMMRDFLRSYSYKHFDEGNIRVLADQVPDVAGLPTHKAIVDEMQALAARAVSGDFVYLHFSGHGSRQPALHDASETDGLDEMFMPRDIGQWNDEIGSVSNSLVDDEIGTLVDAIRNKGAFVWAVFDSCHSGTVMRGASAGEEVKYRMVDPVHGLGIPQQAMDRAAQNAVRTRGFAREGALDGATSGTGGFVAFYAAQTTEQTPEMRLPAGEDGRVPHGVFSFTVLQALSQYPTATYRQIGSEVLQRYGRDRISSPTPLFEGDLDARVFGVSKVEVPLQWPLKVAQGVIRLQAGKIQEISSGAVLALLPSPAASLDQAVGYLQVSSAELTASTLVPLDYHGKKAPAPDVIRDGMYARVVEKKIDFTLRVARPEFAAGCSRDGITSVRNAITQMPAESGSGLRIDWVDAGAAADLRLAFCIPSQGKIHDQDMLWLLPSTGEVVFDGINKTPSITLTGKSDSELAVALADNLARIARVTNLLRLTALGDTTAGLVELRTTVTRRGSNHPEAVSEADKTSVHPGDLLNLEVFNRARFPVDINVLYVGSDYSITHLYRVRVEENGRLPATPMAEMTNESFGAEQMLVIASEGKSGEMAADFGFLQQSAVPKTRGAGGPGEGIGGLLMDAGFGATKTRGGKMPERNGGFSLTPITLQVIE
ncbi:caspase family protein [Mariprofundus erugo]|uniref:caspase family protein n=1 Tax=Mariprofundus erugo TaxID=2528639 RepID=UPI0010FF44D6|nr:caspase family protein [Mariprofundus erugo]TLS78267.1 caspase family protein [Mariprofundus erugo]